MVIIFDLDDTLYDDRTFVLSGFHVVAKFLSSLLKQDEKKIYESLVKELAVSRSEVFNRFLIKQGIYNKKLLSKCISTYRLHHPTIEMYPAAKKLLIELKDYPKYVVTDGNKIVQKNKYLALGLDKYMKKCLCTYAYGLIHSKPSPYCFHKICEWEKVTPDQVVYIADNPKKDFVGIKPLGFKTIRILKGPHKDVFLGPEYEADVVLDHLSQVGKYVH